MTPNKQRVIYDAFPDLFRQGIDKTGLMQYGLCVGDGWSKLIWDLSEAITGECQRLGIEPGKPGFPQAVQVKEKFGELRFYLEVIEIPEPKFSEEEIEDIRRGSGPGNEKWDRYDQMRLAPRQKLDSIYALTREANKLSSTICENCGAQIGRAHV